MFTCIQCTCNWTYTITAHMNLWIHCPVLAHFFILFPIPTSLYILLQAKTYTFWPLSGFFPTNALPICQYLANFVSCTTKLAKCIKAEIVPAKSNQKIQEDRQIQPDWVSENARFTWQIEISNFSTDHDGSRQLRNPVPVPVPECCHLPGSTYLEAGKRRYRRSSGWASRSEVEPGHRPFNNRSLQCEWKI